MYIAYSIIFCFHVYKQSKKNIKSEKVSSLLLIRSNIKKKATLVSVFSTSHIFTISHIFTFFSTDAMCVNKREVTAF